MSTSIEAQGHTVDEAIQIALNQLGVSRDKVEIDILHHPRRGVLGIGARRAKVRATIREAVMPDGEEFDMSGGAGLDDKPRRRRRRGGRNRGRGDEGEQTTPQRQRGQARDSEQRGQQGQPRGERRDQQGRGQQQGRRERDPNERRDRGPRPEASAPVDSEIESPSFDATQAESADRQTFAQPAPRRAPVEEAPLDAEALDAIRARAEELVRELLQKMGFPAEVSSSIDETAGEAVVSVRSESEGLLIGRRGQTLDSLEHIVNRMTLRADAYVEGRVLLDIGDYRKRRRESLDELATRLRSRAVTERRTVQVSPMSPRDRKFFAQAFAGDDSVEVRALGAGFYRRVIVAPAGAGPGAIAEAETAVEMEDDSLENETFAGGEAES
jgi:spoIIIJ-associated protein